MKKRFIWALAFALVLTPAVSYAADVTQDSAIDKIGDWFATVGKSQDEKDRILFERRTERASKRIGDTFERGTKKAGKEMEKFGKDMEEAFQ